MIIISKQVNTTVNKKATFKSVDWPLELWGISFAKITVEFETRELLAPIALGVVKREESGTADCLGPDIPKGIVRYFKSSV